MTILPHAEKKIVEVFQLKRNAFKQLVLVDEATGQEYADVRPVRAFPVQAPHLGISILLENGAEIAWVDDMTQLSPDNRQMLDEELSGREFMPEIAHIQGVSSFSTPCTWKVETDRGYTEFVLKGDEDIRRIGKTALLIADNHGIHFLIRDMFEIDKHSRKILDRFL